MLWVVIGSGSQSSFFSYRKKFGFFSRSEKKLVRDPNSDRDPVRDRIDQFEEKSYLVGFKELNEYFDEINNFFDYLYIFYTFWDYLDRQTQKISKKSDAYLKKRFIVQRTGPDFLTSF